MRLFFAFFTSWTYLRFFMRNELTKTYGDPSNSFSFAMFFPEVVRTPVEKFSNAIFNLVNFTGLFDKVFKQQTEIPGSSSIERKKAMNKMDSELNTLLESDLKNAIEEV